MVGFDSLSVADAISVDRPRESRLDSATIRPVPSRPDPSIHLSIEEADRQVN